MWGRWGHPCGTPFYAEEFLKEHPEYSWQLPYLRDLPTQPWTFFNAKGPADPEGENSADSTGLVAKVEIITSDSSVGVKQL